MIGYVKCFHSNKTMSFMTTGKKLFKKYSEIWEKINSLIGKELDSKPIHEHNNKYIKTKYSYMEIR